MCLKTKMRSRISEYAVLTKIPDMRIIIHTNRTYAAGGRKDAFCGGFTHRDRSIPGKK